MQKKIPSLYEVAAANANAAAEATAAAAPQQQQQLPPPQPQPAADVAAAVFTGAVPSAPEDVQLTIPPVDPLAPGDVVVPLPEA